MAISVRLPLMSGALYGANEFFQPFPETDGLKAESIADVAHAAYRFDVAIDLNR